jgi:hypothetical protein
MSENTSIEVFFFFIKKGEAWLASHFKYLVRFFFGFGPEMSRVNFYWLRGAVEDDFPYAGQVCTKNISVPTSGLSFVLNNSFTGVKLIRQHVVSPHFLVVFALTARYLD